MLALPAAGQDRTRHLSSTRVGVLVYAIALGMVEAGFVGAYLSVRAGAPDVFVPEVYREDNYLGTIITITMLMSAVTAEWFVWSVRARERRQATYAAGLTGLFGLAFVNAQTYLLRTSEVGAGSSPFGALFWAFMLYNGLLVALGLAALLVGTLRVQGRQSTASEPETARAAAWLWQLSVACWFTTWFFVFFLYKN